MPLNFLEELTPSRKPDVQAILDSEEDGLLETIAKPFSTLLDILDTPGSVVRGLLAGEGGRAVSGIFDPSQRVSGQELIGMENDDSLLATLGGVAASIVTDPLLFVNSIGGVSKTGKALIEASDTLKKINVVEKAVQSGSPAARLVNSALGEAESIAFNKIANSGLKEITDETIKAAGLKGLSFGIPFSQAEYVPKTFNKALQSLLDSAGETTIGKALEPTITGAKNALKFLFNTKAETVEAQTLNDLKAADVELAAHEGIKNQVRLEKLIDNIGGDKKLITRAAETVGYDGDGNFIPERAKTVLAEYKATRIDNLNKTIENLKNKFAKDSIDQPNNIQALTKQLNNQISLHTGKAASDIAKKTDKIDLAISNHAKNMGLISGEIGEYSDDFIKQLKESGLSPPQLLTEEKNKFIPVTATSEYAVHYVPTVQTEYGKQFFQANKKAEAEFRQVMESKLINKVDKDFTKRRTLRNKTKEELNDHFKKMGAKEDVISVDPSVIFAQRAVDSKMAIANANTLNAAIAVAAEPIKKKMKEGYVHIADMILDSGNKTTLTGIRNPISGESVEWGLKPKLREVKEGLKSIGMDLQIPKQFVDDIMRRETYSNHPKIEKFFQEIIDPINGVFRKFLTAVPAFLTQNALGNAWSNWMAKVNPVKYGEAGSLLTKYYSQFAKDNKLTPLFKTFAGSMTPEEEKLLAEAVAFGGVNKNVINEYASVAAKNPSLVRSDSVLPPAAIIRAGEKIPISPFEWTTDINRFSEEVSKLAHYLSKRAEGLDPLAAGQSVKKYLFDYTDLTDVEKQLGRRAILFYTFMRKNIPLALTETFMNKRAYIAAESIRRANDDRTVPDYATNQGIVPIGGDKYFNPKMPFFEANTFAPDARNSIRDKVLQMLTPAISAPMSDKPWMEKIPISRHLRLVQNFLDDQSAKSPVAQLVGLNVYTLDPEQQRLSKAKQILKEKLSRESSVVKFEDYFIPKGEVTNPEVQKYMSELNSLRR